MQTIEAYRVRKVGKHLKASKLMHTWVLQVDSEMFQIDLIISRVSGRKQVVVNSRNEYEFHKFNGSLMFFTELKGTPVTLFQEDKTYTLRVFDKTHSEVLLTHKTQKYK